MMKKKKSTQKNLLPIFCVMFFRALLYTHVEFYLGSWGHLYVQNRTPLFPCSIVA